MKKRDLKFYQKEVFKFTNDLLNPKEKKIAKGEFNKVKMPYKMFQGMQQKSKERMNQQQDMDKKLGILADTSRKKNVMQSYFEQKETQKKEMKRSNIGTERGINWHQFSAAKFKNGALNITKEGMKSFGDDNYQDKSHSKKKKKSYEDIIKIRDSNPEYMTGKRFRKKGGAGKKFKGGKRNKKH